MTDRKPIENRYDFTILLGVQRHVPVDGVMMV